MIFLFNFNTFTYYTILIISGGSSEIYASELPANNNNDTDLKTVTSNVPTYCDFLYNISKTFKQAHCLRSTIIIVVTSFILMNRYKTGRVLCYTYCAIIRGNPEFKVVQGIYDELLQNSEAISIVHVNVYRVYYIPKENVIDKRRIITFHYLFIWLTHS